MNLLTLDKKFFIGFISALGLISLLALTPINNDFKKEAAIYDEFQNLYLNVQPRQYRVISATPSLNSIQNREVVIFSSGSRKIMFREGQDIFSISASCVTVIR